MRLKKIILTGVLVLTMCGSGVFAEEPARQEDSSDGILGLLFGDGGPLEDMLPEGTDIGAMEDTFREQMSQADSEVSQVIENVLGKVKIEDALLSSETLGKLAGDLLGQIIGEDIDFSGMAAYADITSLVRASEEQYIKDHNAGIMDMGDVQIVSNGPIYTPFYETEDTEITNLACMIQYNYTQDEQNRLLLVNEAEDIVLFRHEKDEEGNYPVVEATFAEKGENYEPSVEKMCSEVGITPEECHEYIVVDEVMAASDLEQYLNNHPDIKGIEYQGEIRTAEELKQIEASALEELYPQEEAMTETEMAAEETEITGIRQED